MIIDSEEKAKIVVLSAIATVLLCDGLTWMGVVCFLLMLPWGIVGRVAGWLAHPVVTWRTKNGKDQAEVAA